MRLRRARVERFKKFEPPGIEIDFRNKALGEIADEYLILGDNASGKTTILQAIALTLALAQRKVQDFREFSWTGWVADRFLAHGDPVVELEVEFDADELEATQEAASRWWDATHPTGRTGFVSPGDSELVTLRLEGARVRTLGPENEIFQFQGRSYAASGAKMDRRLRDLFPRLPGVFWYDQFRNTASSIARERDQRGIAVGTELPYYLGIAQVEENLKEWYSMREQRGPHPKADFLGQIEALYSKAFPGHTFAGLEPIYDGPTPGKTRFILSDGSHTYALAEMSSGEQAIFPILFQCVKQQIHRSIVIIDEIDLNLHPPLAQLLLGLLPMLGEKNQFIFTTHSRSVSSLVSPHTITRLSEGNPCL
ncbi:MAG: AAA family ATPase [Polyangiaceae bacterium]|nr:AAA family ATPase [Polyangiaceae bacterium]